VDSWVSYAVWWHVYPLGFTGALHAGPGRRLPQLIDWLDYAVELGASGLQLGPIFASSSHGYDTTDHFRIDPRLGTEEDFDALVSAAHEKGLKILLDGVFNHVGPDFQAPDSWFSGSVFEGHDSLRELDHARPEVLDYTVRVMEHWLDRGADGWRLDAAYAVRPAFWKAALDRVRTRHPAAWFVGEMIQGDYAAYLRESSLDAITQYELWKAIWSSLNDGNFFELAWALERHVGFGLPMTFVGNHDVTRIASRLGDPRHLAHALVVLFLASGVPSIYYGDEQAFQGVKEERFGGDDAIRPAFPAAPADLAPYGWPTYRLHERLIGLRRRHAWLASAVLQPAHLTNTAVALTASGDDQRVLALLNIGDEDYKFPVEADGLSPAEAGTDQPDPLTVPAHSWAILTS
jgi:cyclomaltodextrinase / maltogenic alpha-amylase / neopullulanase